MSQFKKSNTDRGRLLGSCNIRSCQAPQATWYNVSTKAYYCGKCARALNDANRRNALATYGHDLVLAPWHHLYTSTTTRDHAAGVAEE